MLPSARDHRVSQQRAPASAGLSLLVLIAMVAAGTPVVRAAGGADSAVPSSNERGLIRQVSQTLVQVVRRAVRLDRVRPAAIFWRAPLRTSRPAQSATPVERRGIDWTSRIGPLTLLDLPPPGRSAV